MMEPPPAFPALSPLALSLPSPSPPELTSQLPTCAEFLAVLHTWHLLSFFPFFQHPSSLCPPHGFLHILQGPVRASPTFRCFSNSPRLVRAPVGPWTSFQYSSHHLGLQCLFTYLPPPMTNSSPRPQCGPAWGHEQSRGSKSVCLWGHRVGALCLLLQSHLEESEGLQAWDEGPSGLGVNKRR